MADFTATTTIPRKRVYDTVITGVESGPYGSFLVQAAQYQDACERAERLEPDAWANCVFGVMYEDDREVYKPQPLTDTLIQAGLDFMAHTYPKHLADIIEERDDAITGDVLLQCSLLGDIIYG